jgi:hypothetical protein
MKRKAKVQDPLRRHLDAQMKAILADVFCPACPWAEARNHSVISPMNAWLAILQRFSTYGHGCPHGDGLSCVSKRSPSFRRIFVRGLQRANERLTLSEYRHWHTEAPRHLTRVARPQKRTRARAPQPRLSLPGW